MVESRVWQSRSLDGTKKNKVNHSKKLNKLNAVS